MYDNVQMNGRDRRRRQFNAVVPLGARHASHAAAKHHRTGEEALDSIAAVLICIDATGNATNLNPAGQTHDWWVATSHLRSFASRDAAHRRW
jgi:hypothetical protein